MTGREKAVTAGKSGEAHACSAEAAKAEVQDTDTVVMRKDSKVFGTASEGKGPGAKRKNC